MTPWPLVTVICGFQSGADLAGATIAQALGYPTGGMMPKDWRTEAGPKPEYQARYGAMESPHAGYEHRTRWNIRNSDGTVIFAYEQLDGGSALTKTMADALSKPSIVCLLPPVSEHDAQIAQVVRAWIVDKRIRVLNVAGNRESKSPGIGARVEGILREAVAR